LVGVGALPKIERQCSGDNIVRTQDLKKMRPVLENTKPADGSIHPFE
jgi:hypothetical protein